jgi:hypothetical protein
MFAVKRPRGWDGKTPDGPISDAEAVLGLLSLLVGSVRPGFARAKTSCSRIYSCTTNWPS